MPSTNRVQFVKDFFFTDITNHVEFLKWACTLEKDDDILLVGILERLASSDKLIPMEPFYGSLDMGKRLPKNAFNIAHAYSQIQALSGHPYNIFECAFMDSTAHRYRAYLCLVIQISFFSCLVVYNVFDNRVMITPGEHSFELVITMLVMSTILLFLNISRQRRNALNFNRVMRMLVSDMSDQLFLLFNRGINEVMGVLVFFFNIYFILTSNTPTDAVLNSVALVFIIEIDDVFRPDWDEADQEDALVFILRNYIVGYPEKGDIFVEHNGMEGVSLLRDDSNYYIKLRPFDAEIGTFEVSIFMENSQQKGVITSYKEVTFKVSGNRSSELHESFGHFSCLENLEDVTASHGSTYQSKKHLTII